MLRLSRIALNILRALLILTRTAFVAFWRVLSPMPDQQVNVSEHALSSLSELRSRTKYVEIPGSIYNGMRPENLRRNSEAQLNSLIDRLRGDLPLNPSKKLMLAEFSKTIAEFESVDTEDREQLLRYLHEIMDILGVTSSDGLLSRWMYGPLSGPLIDHSPRTKLNS